MPHPTVSVILPCYNAHRYLTRALDSVRAQTFRDFEIIVVDDGSTDPDTRRALAALGSDVRVVHQHNLGLAAARNTGFREAKGNYVVPLDCDDWLEPTFLEKTLASLVAFPNAGFAFTDFALEGEGEGQLRRHYNFFEQLFTNQLPYCMLVKKHVWKEVGGYDESMREGYEDWELNIRMGGCGWFGAAVPEPLFHYHVSRSGMLLSMSSGLHGRLWTAIQRRNGRLYHTSNLIGAWKRWRDMPSAYPLPLYFAWLAMHKFLPERLFAAIFRGLIRLSQSRRVTRKFLRDRAGCGVSKISRSKPRNG